MGETTSKESRSRPDRQRKRSRFEAQVKQGQKRSQPILLGGVAILVVIIVAFGFILAFKRGSEQDGAVAEQPASADSVPVVASTDMQTRYAEVSAVNGEVRWPMSTFDDGQAHYYSFVDNDKSVDFFILRSSDGVVRAAHDACDVCFAARKGYRQEGDLMVCNNCGRQFPSVRINEVKGGCNPAPLKRTEEGSDLVIRSSDIIEGERYF